MVVRRQRRNLTVLCSLFHDTIGTASIRRGESMILIAISVYRTLGVLLYLSSRSQLQYLARETRRTSESDPKSSPQSV